MTSCGFVYVATGPRYLAEARHSATSLLAAMPGVDIALVTDVQPDADTARLFTTVLVRPDARHQPIDKLLAWEAPFERCVFLDTDTHVCGDLADLFRVLDQFDLAAAPETLRGWHYTLPDVPLAFPEYNTGVLAFRRTPATAEFFQAWKSDYEKLHVSAGFVADQPAFRWAAFRLGIRIAPLPTEFHFITLTPNYTMWAVRLLHGRANLAALASDLNRHLGARAYVPGLGPITAFQGHKVWFTQFWRLLFRYLRISVATFLGTRPPSPHWTQEERRLTGLRKKTPR